MLVKNYVNSNKFNGNSLLCKTFGVFLLDLLIT